MPRDLNALLEDLRSVVERQAARAAVADANGASAAALASRLPLVHRTGKPGAPGWRSIFARSLIETRPAGTPREQSRGGYARAAYFFFGAGCYPAGRVALLLRAEHPATQSGTFTPFDSGSLGAPGAGPFVTPVAPAQMWEEADRDATFDRHQGLVSDCRHFCGHYIAAHFRDPLAYSRMPQTSEPDFPAYHGLRSVNGDRRAWTIEVQLHDDVPIAPSPDRVAAVVVDGWDLLEELPIAWRPVARVHDPGLDPRPFDEAVADAIVRTATETA